MRHEKQRGMLEMEDNLKAAADAIMLEKDAFSSTCQPHQAHAHVIQMHYLNRKGSGRGANPLREKMKHCCVVCSSSTYASNYRAFHRRSVYHALMQDFTLSLEVGSHI